MRSNTFLIDNSEPEFIFILGSPLLMEGVCGLETSAENWSAPTVPHTDGQDER